MEWINPYNDILKLVWCSINNIKPEPSYLCESDLSKLIGLCDKHKITALVNMSVSKADDDVVSPEIKQAFNKEYLKAVRVNIMFDSESDRIFRLFEENHICYLPLKGCILKDYYPEAFFRQMGDIDVLILPQDSGKVKKLMTESGYECKTFGISRHDEYFKKPFYTYEIHRSLFHESNDVWSKYYNNIFDWLIKETADSYEYRFSKEDFYIYFFLHGFNHYRSAGIGIRFLVDIYQYCTKEELDYDYIAKELNKLGVEKEEYIIRELAFSLFRPENNLEYNDLKEELKPVLLRIMYSGIYGNQDIMINSRIDKYMSEKSGHNKVGYILSRIFSLSPKYIRKYPGLYKSVIGRPVIVLKRLFDKVIKQKYNVKKEINIIKDYKQ